MQNILWCCSKSTMTPRGVSREHIWHVLGKLVCHIGNRGGSGNQKQQWQQEALAAIATGNKENLSQDGGNEEQKRESKGKIFRKQGKEVSVWLDMNDKTERGFRSESDISYLNGWMVRCYHSKQRMAGIRGCFESIEIDLRCRIPRWNNPVDSWKCSIQAGPRDMGDLIYRVTS